MTPFCVTGPSIFSGLKDNLKISVHIWEHKRIYQCICVGPWYTQNMYYSTSHPQQIHVWQLYCIFILHHCSVSVYILNYHVLFYRTLQSNSINMLQNVLQYSRATVSHSARCSTLCVVTVLFALQYFPEGAGKLRTASWGCWSLLCYLGNRFVLVSVC